VTAAAEARAPSIDVSRLPSTVFGHRDLAWWGTVLFAVIEGTTLFVCLVAYLYLRRNFEHWPPPRTPPPDWVPFVVQIGLMALSWIPQRFLNRATKRFDRNDVTLWLVVTLVFALAFGVLRWLELEALGTRWDQDAYGSATWVLLVTHGTLLLTTIGETAFMVVLFLFSPRVAERHYSDTDDSTFYWYFLTGSWIVLGSIVLLVPRL
jgi:heme/copper-type cytochrome/quinol oxidase subunit 3